MEQRSPGDKVVTKLLNSLNGKIADPSRGVPPRPYVVASMSKSANTLAFPEAVKRVMEGAKMTRESWKDEGEFIFLNEGRLRVIREGALYDLIVGDGDLFGVDWRQVRVSDVAPSTTQDQPAEPVEDQG